MTPVPRPASAGLRLAVTALLVVATAACGHDARTPRPAGDAPAQAAPAGAGSGDAGLDRFVAAVQTQLPQIALDRRDEEVEALGVRACESLAAGHRAAAVAGGMRAEGVAAADVDRLVALARSTACPG